ncbi:MAG TPA: cation-translocating P-type ATPase, partial [Chitinophagaceae bacterium]
NYVGGQPWAASLLFALTLAMSAVPEEIPVAFSSFMALGAYKMSKLGIISRQPQVIENLGSVSVICLDKTGTITQNKMAIQAIYDHEKNLLLEPKDNMIEIGKNVLAYGVLASESDPFDAMEKAIWEAYRLRVTEKGILARKMIYEYPLEGLPPMMTHVYDDGNSKLVAGKGAVERIVRICRLNREEEETIMKHTRSLGSKGYRVIGVAGAIYNEHQLPAAQDNFGWQFKGLLALYDPPKKNIADVISKFYKAKIGVKLITGDYPETAMNIAGQAGIEDNLHYISGDQVIKMSNEELKQAVNNTNIFARMFPDAKLRVIDALKANGEIVAMTGDGVNDAPALKSANIGIAMGEKGTEIARQASDLVLTDDNLDRMVDAIKEGRKIFSNLKKGVRYIISIHIPIILTASLPVIFGWTYPNIFTPIHVIFLEMIMGPTCSIFFEKEPVEKNIMEQLPRERSKGLFTREELLVSLVQGLIIAAGVLILYYYFMQAGNTLEQTRTIVFTTLILSNVFLTFVNRSFNRTIYYTSRYQNPLVPVILIISTLFLVALHFIPFVRELFRLSGITIAQFGLCFAIAFASVMWFEVYKTGLPDNTHVDS